jgi:hypothetical protein
MVRLGPTMLDEGGFDLGWRGQLKTGARPWCPLFPELAAEMATWDKLPGPFVRNKLGGNCSRESFTKLYDAARAALAAKGITTLEGTTLHGLRATAVVRLKREGFDSSVISDMVGMSLAMVQRYCRFEDKRATGKAVLAVLAERKAKATAIRNGACLRCTARPASQTRNPKCLGVGDGRRIELRLLRHKPVFSAGINGIVLGRQAEIVELASFCADQLAKFAQIILRRELDRGGGADDVPFMPKIMDDLLGVADDLGAGTAMEFLEHRFRRFSLAPVLGANR